MIMRKEVPNHISKFDLVKHLELHGVAHLGRWTLTLKPEDDLIWVTDQLGIELGFYANDADGCGQALDLIATCGDDW